MFSQIKEQKKWALTTLPLVSLLNDGFHTENIVSATHATSKTSLSTSSSEYSSFLKSLSYLGYIKNNL